MAKRRITKLERLYDIYRGNVSEAMAQDLADHLGVTADAVIELGAGYAPVVEFTNGPNHNGWWAFPERDSKGELVGLGLRHCPSTGDHYKAMHLPSKRGLIYPLNPNHRLGQPIYKPGPQNWMRTMKAGVNCPVCGKPDGCLVSAEQPDNSPVAICIRISEGAKQEVKGGGSWLHVLESDGFIDQFAAPLPESETPVLVVEGASDVLAALSLGFVAVGRPNAKGGLPELGNLLRGRPVIVIGENDLKDDGSCPGREGMLMAAQVLRRVCPDVLKVMPPVRFKDLRAWIRDGGIDADGLLKYAEERGDRTVDLTVLPDTDPLTAGEAWLKDTYMVGARPLIRVYGKDTNIYKYIGGRYREASVKEVTDTMYRWAYKKSHVVSTVRGDVISPINADQKWVGNAWAAVRNDIRVPDDLKAPCWINNIDGPPADQLVVFQNGILHLPSFLEGKSGYMLDPTPDYFNTICLPYEFDETALCPDCDAFLEYALPPEDRKLWWQWVGYCLTRDTQFQKFMLFRGVKLSGKSTSLNLISDLVGEEHYSGPQFSELLGRYSMGDLVGKLVLGIDEADITTNADVDALTSVIKVLTGDLKQKTEEKYKKAVGARKLCARITMTANETPYLPDNADAVARRMMIIEFKKPAEVEDTKLRQKLYNELPGVAIKALRALRAIYRNDCNGNPIGFSEPESMLKAKAAWREHANPMGTFYSHCLEYRPGEHTEIRDLKDAFDAYQAERGAKPWGLARMQERLKLACQPGVVSDKIHMDNGRPVSVMKNLAIKDWAVEAYLEGS